MQRTNGHGPKRAILYARVSTDEQARSGYSLAQQLEALREYASYEVLEEVSDPGQSGASLERPGMDHARDLIATGGVALFLAQDRDRFAREPALHYLLKQELAEHGCDLRALNDRGDHTPEGELTDGILDHLAKYERAKLAERTWRGKRKKVRQGKILATHTADYGFRFNTARDGYEVDEEKMAVVRRIFRWIGVEGWTIRRVRKALDDLGAEPPGGYMNKSRRWNETQLRSIVSNDAYNPHSFEEVEPLVAPQVAANLDPPLLPLPQEDHVRQGHLQHEEVSESRFGRATGLGGRLRDTRRAREA